MTCERHVCDHPVRSGASKSSGEQGEGDQSLCNTLTLRT